MCSASRDLLWLGVRVAEQHPQITMAADHRNLWVIQAPLKNLLMAFAFGSSCAGKCLDDKREPKFLQSDQKQVFALKGRRTTTTLDALAMSVFANVSAVCVTLLP